MSKSKPVSLGIWPGPMQPQTGGEQPNTEGLNLLGTHKRTDMKTINLLILWFQLRALEATMYGQEEALTVVRDPETINRITLARINCRREWHRVRGRYLDMKRSRNVWRMA